MCPVIVFIEFTDPYGRKALFTERRMISSPAEPVVSEHQRYSKLVDIPFSDLLYVACKLAGFPVIFSRSLFS